MRRRARRDRLADTDVGRRDVLEAVGVGGLAAGLTNAVDNVLLGYGLLGGTNLFEQPLEREAADRFGPSPFRTRLNRHTVEYRDGVVTASGPSTEPVAVSPTAAPDAVESVDADLGFDGALAALVADLGAIEAGDVTFAFSRSPAFFERIRRGDPRPLTVEAVRGHRFRTPEPAVIETFADADPADPAAIVEGLTRGFRTFSGYDLSRYLAGSIQDNVIFGARDLREAFRSPADFDALLAGENTGLFCYEFAYRSIEALHAVPAAEQTVPVLGAVVTDARHKHVYTGIASVIREGDDLVVPMTFVDYTHSTLYDDLALRGLLGEGVEAYDDRHRTTGIYWNRYARW